MNPLGASINGRNVINTPGGPSTSNNTFDFLQHPLFANADSVQEGLQFDGLYSQMAAFKEKLNAFVEESCNRVEEAKENQAAIKDENKAAIRDLENETESEKKAQKDLFAAIASEREEDSEARRSQAEKERYTHSLSSQLSDIQSELDEMKKQLMSRRERKRRMAGKVKEMARLNIPERELLESRTGLRIGTPGGEHATWTESERVGRTLTHNPTLNHDSPADLISFTFSHLDASNPNEEAFFIFALSKRSYTVPVIQPALPESLVKPLLAELNTSRNAFKFIKQMRKLLKEKVESGARVNGTAEDYAAQL